ncbi:MAG: hypothetical protein NXY57DRAFT_967881 [Lentinula lateritia]|nr:MAG: hypothetical protein NXY57DRAFT_967881 [Lentinula lateritia]
MNLCACHRFIPHSSTTHPYCLENERLSLRVQDLEAQLVESQLENSALTLALHNTSHSLEAQQREVEQLRTSQWEVAQQGLDYSCVLDQYHALERALPGRSKQTLVERLCGLQEELLLAREEKEVAEGRCSSSARWNSELQASIVQQQGLVDESNALAAQQRGHIETLQEEFPEEGFYEVSLPPVSELEEELTCMCQDLCGVATFAHRLYRSSPGSALQHHNQHLGGLIEAMSALLWQGLDSTDSDLIVQNFQLVLEYLQASRGIHGELHVRTLSNFHWFFDNAANRDNGLYHLVLDNLRFQDDFPFSTIAQHAGYAPPFESALEPPLHCCMFALDTPLPHHGAGRWEDTVPLFQNLLPMLISLSVGDDAVTPLPVSQPIPLFLLEQSSPTSPSPPRTSPVPPPLFGSVAPLAIALTGDDDDDLYESLEEFPGTSPSGRVPSQEPTTLRPNPIYDLFDSYIDVLASTTPTTDLSGPPGNPLKGRHLFAPATTRSFLSSVAVPVAPFELQPAPSTLQHKPSYTKPYLKTYFDPGLTSPFPSASPYFPGHPPHLPVHPFQDKPNASATAATSLDASRASSAGVPGSPPYLPILPKS